MGRGAPLLLSFNIVVAVDSYRVREDARIERNIPVHSIGLAASMLTSRVPTIACSAHPVPQTVPYPHISHVGEGVEGTVRRNGRRASIR